MGGRRVKTIDVHAHCVIPEAYALWGSRSTTIADPASAGSAAAPPRNGRADIDMEALSINPAWYGAERDLVTKVIKIRTSGSPSSARSTRTASSPSRRWLSIPGPGGAAAGRRREEARARGAAVGASVAGDEFSDRSFIPSGRRPGAQGAHLHSSASTPDLAGASRATAGWRQRIGNPLDDHRALAPHLRGHARSPRAQGSARPTAEAFCRLRAALRQQPRVAPTWTPASS